MSESSENPVQSLEQILSAPPPTVEAEQPAETPKASEKTKENGMFSFLSEALKKFGPRESATPNELALGEHMKASLAKSCDRVEGESFFCHPKAFLSAIRLMVPAYALALLFYWWNLNLLSFLIMAAAVAVFVIEFVMYRELHFFEMLSPAGESVNVYGVLKPSGEVKRRVIVSGHLDSAYECNIWYRYKKFSVPIMAIAAFAVVWLTLMSFMRSIAWCFDKHYSGFFTFGFTVSLIGYFAVALFSFFHTDVPVPGAMDNLAGCAVVNGLAETFAKERAEGKGLEHTEILFAALGSEEAGLRGSRRFVEVHQRDWGSHTHAIVLDGICDESQLVVVPNEIQLNAKHDAGLVALAEQSASKCDLKLRRMPLLIGATDAASFTKAGVSAVTICACDIAHLPENYHTRLDTLDRVHPESLDATHDLVHAMIHTLDDQTRAC